MPHRTPQSRPILGVTSLVAALTLWGLMLMASEGITAGYLVVYAWMLLLPISFGCSIAGLWRRERPVGLALVGLILSIGFIVSARFLLR